MGAIIDVPCCSADDDYDQKLLHNYMHNTNPELNNSLRVARRRIQQDVNTTSTSQSHGALSLPSSPVQLSKNNSVVIESTTLSRKSPATKRLRERGCQQLKSILKPSSFRGSPLKNKENCLSKARQTERALKDLKLVKKNSSSSRCSPQKKIFIKEPEVTISMAKQNSSTSSYNGKAVSLTLAPTAISLKQSANNKYERQYSKKIAGNSNCLGIELFESENSSTPCGTEEGTNSKSKMQSDQEPTPSNNLYNMDDLFNSDAISEDYQDAADTRMPRREQSFSAITAVAIKNSSKGLIRNSVNMTSNNYLTMSKTRKRERKNSQCNESAVILADDGNSSLKVSKMSSTLTDKQAGRKGKSIFRGQVSSPIRTNSVDKYGQHYQSRDDQDCYIEASKNDRLGFEQMTNIIKRSSSTQLQERKQRFVLQK